ncbi:transposable element Tcb1 transposase [Trichonephila clavipes]|nr:transposable element Tcb1 transposase [Trichonephila clavipes]
MIEAGRSARQVGRSVLTVSRCWDQWTEWTLFIRRQGSRCPRQTTHRKDHHIIRHARVEHTASLSAVQTPVASSLWTHVSSRTIIRCLAEGHLVSRCLYLCCQ